MTKRQYLSLLVSVVLVIAGVSGAQAVPHIAVDFDPAIMGIQDTLMVNVGDTFTANVVIHDPDVTPTNPTIFNRIILETFFNDVGTVLSPGPTGVSWIPGGLASGFPLFGPSVIDLFGPSGGFPVNFGPGGAGVGGSFPGGGFANGSGAVGLFDVVAFGSLFPTFGGGIGPDPLPIFSIDFTAAAVGTSTILVGGTDPFGHAAVTLETTDGQGMDVSIPLNEILEAGTVTVSAVIPEPSTILLFGTGLLGLIGYRRRRQTGVRHFFIQRRQTAACENLV